MPCGGRSVTGMPWQWLWIEIAAWWPCSTAQMMFFGPQAASPPKKTPGSVRLEGHLVDHRHVPLVELDAEVALDPGERVLLADGEDDVVAGDDDGVDDRRVRAPARPTRGARTPCPTSVPFSMTKRFGAWLMTISTPSSSASSSSQGEALKNARGRRAITLMSLPPRRRDERQQSIAVLPTPMISTRSPIESMWPKATDSSQSMPMWMRSRVVAAGDVEVLAARRAGADEDGVEVLRRAALAGSSPACCSGCRRPCRGWSRSPRRGPLRAAGRPGCWCASGRRACRASRRSPPRSRAASGRWRRSARPGRRRCRRCACRSSSAGSPAGGRRCRRGGRRRRASGGRSRPACRRSGVRRQAGSQGRSQVRPRIPGNTFDSRLNM